MGNFMKDVPDLDAFQNILGIYLKMKCFILCCLVGKYSHEELNTFDALIYIKLTNLELFLYQDDFIITSLLILLLYVFLLWNTYIEGLKK